MKAINENLLTCGDVRAYAYARVARGCARSRVYWGGSEEGGVIVGRKGNQWKYEGGEDGGEREARNEKAFTLCKKVSAEKIMGWDLSKKCPKSDPKRGKTRKKWAAQGKKRARFLEKSPGIGPKTGKSGKNGNFGAKKVGWGSGEKMGFTADFAML